ncbi:unnamed protein product, partial [Mesorhabditis spiculigera]
MLIRWLLAAISLVAHISAEYCGNNKIPYGIEVHKDGRLVLLCSKPECFEKKYAECDERPLRTHGCPSNSSWVGGVQRVAGSSVLYTQCCDYEYLAEYSELLYKKVTVRRGEFFEGEEKQDKGGDVTSFDVITDIQMLKEEKGEPYYNIQVHRYNCAKAPDPEPVWLPADPWPHFLPKLPKKHRNL